MLPNVQRVSASLTTPRRRPHRRRRTNLFRCFSSSSRRPLPLGEDSHHRGRPSSTAHLRHKDSNSSNSPLLYRAMYVVAMLLILVYTMISMDGRKIHKLCHFYQFTLACHFTKDVGPRPGSKTFPTFQKQEFSHFAHFQICTFNNLLKK